MPGKNNHYLKQVKSAQKQQTFTIRKTLLGVASVAIASSLYLGQSASVQASEVLPVEANLTSNVAPVTEEASSTSDQEMPIAPVTEEARPINSDDVDANHPELPVEMPISHNPEPVGETNGEHPAASPHNENNSHPVLEDTKAPRLVSVTTDKDSYQAGEDIVVIVVAEDNRELKSAWVQFSRVEGNSGPETLHDSVHYTYNWALNHLGQFSTQFTIKTDPNHPSNQYKLSSVFLGDASDNQNVYTSYSNSEHLPNPTFSIGSIFIPFETTHIYNENQPPYAITTVQIGVKGKQDIVTGKIIQEPVTEIIEYGPELVPFQEIIQFNPNYEYDPYWGTMHLGITQIGQQGLKNPLTGEITKPAQDQIEEYGAELFSFEYIREFNPNLDINQTQIIQHGSKGAKNPVTGEIIRPAQSEIVQVGPEVLNYGIVREFNPNLDFFQEIYVQEGHDGLQNPITGEVIRPAQNSIVEFGPYPISYKTKTLFNPNLEIDEQKVIQVGQNGLLNPHTNDEYMSAQEEIVELGPQSFGFETVFQFNPNLSLGVFHILSSGKSGLRNPITGEVIQAAKDQVIERGPEPIVFEWKKLFNPDLKPDEYVVIQEGNLGRMNPISGETIQPAKPGIMEVGPDSIREPWIMHFNPDLEVYERKVIQEAIIGLRNPISGEILKTAKAGTMEVGPERISPDQKIQFDPNLAINERKTIKPGQDGLRNPITGEIITPAKPALIKMGAISNHPDRTIKFNPDLGIDRWNVVYEGRPVLINPETHEIIQSPESQIIEYGPETIKAPWIKKFNPDLKPGTKKVIENEETGLRNPATHEIIKSSKPGTIELGPDYIYSDWIRKFNPDLNPEERLIIQEQELGLQNPITGETIKAATPGIIILGPSIIYAPWTNIFNPDISPNESTIIQDQVPGLKNPITGEVITPAQSGISELGPQTLHSEWIENFDPNLKPYERRVIKDGKAGLINPITNEVLTPAEPGIVNIGPITVDPAYEIIVSSELDPNNAEYQTIVEGEYGLINPLTRELIKAPVKGIKAVPPRDINTSTVRILNRVDIIDISSGTNLGNYHYEGSHYDLRLNYNVKQLNDWNNLNLEIISQELVSERNNEFSEHGIAIERYVKVYVKEKSNLPLTDIEKQYLPGVIYEDKETEPRYYNLLIQFEGDKLYGGFTDYSGHSVDFIIRNFLNDQSLQKYVYLKNIEVKNDILKIPENHYLGPYQGPSQSIIVTLGTRKNIEVVDFSTEYLLGEWLEPGADNIITSTGSYGLKDTLTGQLIKEPNTQYITYAPVEVPFKTKRIFNPNAPSGDRILTPGENGLKDPYTGKMIKPSQNQTIEYGPDKQLPSNPDTEKPGPNDQDATSSPDSESQDQNAINASSDSNREFSGKPSTQATDKPATAKNTPDTGSPATQSNPDKPTEASIKETTADSTDKVDHTPALTDKASQTSAVVVDKTIATKPALVASEQTALAANQQPAHSSDKQAQAPTEQAIDQASLPVTGAVSYSLLGLSLLSGALGLAVFGYRKAK